MANLKRDPMIGTGTRRAPVERTAASGKGARSTNGLPPDQRRAQIIKVTLSLIERHGLEGATTAKIAAAAGITEPTLYRHFGSRKGILLAALDATYTAALDLIDSAERPDAMDWLREVGDSHNARLRRQKRGFADALFEFVAAPASLGLRDAVRRGAVETIARRLVEIIELGKAQGSIRPEVDTHDLAWQVISFFWVEDIAYLMDVGDHVLTGLSIRSLDTLLREAATPPEG